MKTAPLPAITSDPNTLTPVQKVGPYWLKRDDAFQIGGVNGAKARTVLNGMLRTPGLIGVVTGGGKGSRRVNVAAQLAKHLGVKAVIFTPTGKPTLEMEAAVAAGAERITVVPGYTKTLQAKASKYAAERGAGWCYAAFGGECREAVEESETQAANLPWKNKEVKRIVICAGSAMVLAGLLNQHANVNSRIPVLAVAVGHDPTEQLDRWAPFGWNNYCTIIKPVTPWERPAPESECSFLGVKLDAYFEAKCVPFLRAGDLFWIIGITACQ